MKRLSLNQVTLAYLLLPNLLFLFGFCRPLWALLHTLLLVLGIYFFTEANKPMPARVTTPLPRWAWGVLLLWIFDSGIGAWVFQNLDYTKHNAIFSLLWQKPWPIYVNEGALGEVPVTYYFGYYLVPAFLGKLGTFRMAEIAQALWAALGIILIVKNLLAARVRPLTCLVVLIAASGLDWIGMYFINAPTSVYGHDNYHAEWWSIYFSYQNGTTLLYWVPQHAVAAWLVCAVFLKEKRLELTSRTSTQAWLLSLLWSPFAFVGMAPFIAQENFRVLCKNSKILPGDLLARIVCALAILPVALFLLSTANSPLNLGLLTRPDIWPDYLLFLILELGIFCLIVKTLLPHREPVLARLSLISLVLLSLIPLYNFGLKTDWFMRVSIPALFFFWIFFYETLLSTWRTLKFSHKAIVALPVLISWLTPLLEIYRPLVFYRSTTPYRQEKTLHDINYRLRDQYWGQTNSFFYRNIARSWD